MAYFSNGTEGEAFDNECATCKYGTKSCPIAYVQMNYNYDACNIPVARKILDDLVSNIGICAMKKEFKEDLELDPNKTSQNV